MNKLHGDIMKTPCACDRPSYSYDLIMGESEEQLFIVCMAFVAHRILTMMAMIEIYDDKVLWAQCVSNTSLTRHWGFSIMRNVRLGGSCAASGDVISLLLLQFSIVLRAGLKCEQTHTASNATQKTTHNTEWQSLTSGRERLVTLARQFIYRYDV